MKRARVYVVQQQLVMEHGELREKFDFSDCERFGKVEFLLEQQASPYDMLPVLHRLHSKLCEIQTTDWLVLTGNPVLIGVVCVIASYYLGGKLRILQWSAPTRGYIPITMENVHDGYAPALA